MFDLRPLRSAGFRHLAAAYWVNEFGTWVGEIALTIVVYDRTHSPLGSAALFTALRSVPAVLAPLLTTRIETMRVRSVLATLYLLEASLYAGIAVITRHFSLPAVLTLAGIDASLAVTAKALTRSATADSLLRTGLLREGNGILNLGYMAATAVAPVMGGALVAWRGAESALLVDVATFVVTAIIILTASGLHIESDQIAGWAGRTRNGFDVLRTHHAVRRLMVAAALIMMLSGIPIPIEVVFVKQTLHMGDSGYGLLLGSWGLGTVVGATAYIAMRDARLIVVIGSGTLLTALGYGGLAASPTLAIAFAASAVGGLGNGAAWIAAVTSLQERIPLATQSAIMSVLETVAQIMPAIGFIAGGALTALTSPRVAYAVSAVGVGLVLAVLALRPIDRVRLSVVTISERPSSTDGLAAGAQETETPERTPPLQALTN